jgi:hypothetical protein
MSKIDDGGAAFPSHAGDPEATDPRNRISCGGLTKREYFAAAALTGMGMWSPTSSVAGVEARAEWAFRQADAMIAASNGDENV